MVVSEQYGLGVVYFVFPYAFATTNARFTRNQFLAIALTPLIVLTAIGVPLLLLFDWPWLSVPLAINASGTVGDIWIALTLLSYRSDMTVVDNKTGLEVYGLTELEGWETTPAMVGWELVVGTAGRVLLLAIGIGVLIRALLVAIGLDSVTIGVSESPLLVALSSRWDPGYSSSE